jgi:hypothetical protein
MISPNEGEIGRGMARAQAAAVPSIKIDALADKWSDVSDDEPLCAACGSRIKSGAEDDEGMPVVPVRLFRKQDGKGLALHPKCFAQLIIK